MKKEKGQTLIEAVFVITIVGFILSGLVAAIIYFARVARTAKYRSWAASLAQERLEYLRGEKEKDPETFWTNIASYAGEETLSSSEYPGEFVRNTDIEIQEASSPRRAKITVEVSWQDGSQTRKVTVKSYLTE